MYACVIGTWDRMAAIQSLERLPQNLASLTQRRWDFISWHNSRTETDRSEWSINIPTSSHNPEVDLKQLCFLPRSDATRWLTEIFGETVCANKSIANGPRLKIWQASLQKIWVEIQASYFQLSCARTCCHALARWQYPFSWAWKLTNAPITRNLFYIVSILIRNLCRLWHQYVGVIWMLRHRRKNSLDVRRHCFSLMNLWLRLTKTIFGAFLVTQEMTQLWSDVYVSIA
jgi:hypothetical protein